MGRWRCGCSSFSAGRNSSPPSSPTHRETPAGFLRRVSSSARWRAEPSGSECTQWRPFQPVTLEPTRSSAWERSSPASSAQTSVFMIFELTQDYQILVPLMVANLLAYAIATRFQPKPIYHALLEQDGIHLPGPASRFVAGTSRAGDIMTPARFFLSEDLSLGEAAPAIRDQPLHSPV